MELVAAAKLAYMWLTTAKGGSQKGLDEARTEFDEAGITADKLQKSIFDMSGTNWNSHPAEYTEDRETQVLGRTAQ